MVEVISKLPNLHAFIFLSNCFFSFSYSRYNQAFFSGVMLLHSELTKEDFLYSTGSILSNSTLIFKQGVNGLLGLLRICSSVLLTISANAKQLQCQSAYRILQSKPLFCQLTCNKTYANHQLSSFLRRQRSFSQEDLYFYVQPDWRISLFSIFDRLFCS